MDESQAILINETQETMQTIKIKNERGDINKNLIRHQKDTKEIV